LLSTHRGATREGGGTQAQDAVPPGDLKRNEFTDVKLHMIKSLKDKKIKDFNCNIFRLSPFAGIP